MAASKSASSASARSSASFSFAPASQFFSVPLRDHKEEKDNKEEKKRITAIPASASPVIPSHSVLLEHFIAQLHATHEEVYTGVVVEQSLVGLAGIKTIQTGVEFGRTEDGTTCFKLRFSNAMEKEMFERYYNTHYPGFIKKTIAISGSAFTEVNVDTMMLYQTVGAKLAEYHCSSSEQQRLVLS